jgi:SAM-dependent methyltransferase
VTSTDTDRVARQTIADFGDQWTRFPGSDGFFGSPALFDDVFGPLVDRRAMAGQRVAEIGTGPGRFIAILLDAGAAHAVAVEPSAAFDVLRQNTAAWADRITYLRAPGDQLPAGLELDYVFSIGVLHHVPDPVPVLRAALAALKRGGTIAIWLYGREGNGLYLSLALPLRVVSSRLPHPLLWGVTRALDPFLVAYSGLCRLVPLPLHEYMRAVIARLSGDKRRLVVYDQLNPAYARYYTRAEAISLLEDAGFVDVRAYHRHGYSWALTGRRP